MGIPFGLCTGRQHLAIPADRAYVGGMTQYQTVESTDVLLRDGTIKLHAPEHFEGMRKAGRLAAEILDEMAAFVQPGVTTGQIDDLVRKLTIDGGAVPGQHQEDLLAQFRLAMRGRGLDCSKLDDEELWAFGQHHGLRTPLIDWTKSPYVALFFAFDEPDVEGVENPSRAVFCLNMAALFRFCEVY